MISITELEKNWQSIKSMPGISVGRRIDDEHSLDFFISYDENSKMQLVLISSAKHTLPNSTQNITVKCNKRDDNRYAVCLVLENSSLENLFVSVCWDIINCSRNMLPEIGERVAIKRFKLWHKLFEKPTNKRMSDAQIKGMVGELCFLKDVLISKYGAKKATLGWLGPIGGDRDFEFEDLWYEVKCISLSRDLAEISSIDQLDIERPGYLVINRIEKSSIMLPESVSLNNLIESIYGSIIDDENVATEFLSKLQVNGYDENDLRCAEPYICYGIEMYDVGEDFPRIRRSKLSSSIVNAKYTLSISSLEPYKKET